jgi:HNH endonuclease
VNRRYAAVAERAAYRCEYCHAPEAVFNFSLEVDHVTPQSRGGTNRLDNL